MLAGIRLLRLRYVNLSQVNYGWVDLGKLRYVNLHYVSSG